MPSYQIHGLRIRLPTRVSGFREMAEHSDPDVEAVWADGPEPANAGEAGWQEIPLRQRPDCVPLYRAWRKQDGTEYLWYCAAPARTLKYRIQPKRRRIEIWPNAEVSTLKLVRPVFGQALERQRKEIDAQIDRLITAVAEGSLPDLQPIRAKIDELARRGECDRLLAQIESGLPEFRQALSKQQAASIAAP